MSSKDKSKVGRPTRWAEGKTKIGVDKETHRLLKAAAEKADIPVLELMYYLVRHPNFPDLVNDIAKSFKEKQRQENNED